MIRLEILETLSKCRESHDPDLTRELIFNLLKNNADNENINNEKIVSLLQEILVIILHGIDTNANSKQLNQKQPISLLSAIELPSTIDFPEKSSSASDIPSHSSSSSELDQDIENENSFSKESIDAALISPDMPEISKKSELKFETLIKEIETSKSWTDSIELKPFPNESLNSASPDLDCNESKTGVTNPTIKTNSLFVKIEEFLKSKVNEIITFDILFNIIRVICDEIIFEKDEAISCQEDVEILLDPFVGQVITFDIISSIIDNLSNLFDLSPPPVQQLMNVVPDLPTNFELIDSSLNLITPAKTTLDQTISTSYTSASKRPRIDFTNIDPNLPAWKIPKSPLDKLFRSGYGGFGQPDLTDVIQIVEVEDGLSDDDVAVDNQTIKIEDLPEDFGKELFEKSFENEIPIYNHFESELINSTDNYLPENHPSISIPTLPGGDYQLTSNSSLNNMILESYRNLVKNYGKKDRSVAPVTESIVMKPSFPYDYDEATCGTSIDSDGYRKITSSKRAQLYRIGENSPLISPDMKKTKNKTTKKKTKNIQKSLSISNEKEKSKKFQEMKPVTKPTVKSAAKSKSVDEKGSITLGSKKSLLKKSKRHDK